jgi:hypothetical protein
MATHRKDEHVVTEPSDSGDEPKGALYLPQPTGSHSVGATSIHLNDVSRCDPWVPEATSRELMVSLWYPAQPLSGQRAQYLTPTESELLLKDAGITAMPGR